ncbi:EamA family transporter RarD [Denitrificimonas sp. JX-1]|uniref:EamA family transporter RarD n=1 Tax=Denitrificimonas halotolerans TaxID=3098930 RepID=A0ABU5GQ25_9GAMM|nr:EamA family transporter RarD [Denitrificimonas sp. JX-1]MDY7218830.1 EamA family transporter RarD [Denitrificimonas sp. JX-1]
MHISGRGVAMSVFASLIFAIIPAYALYLAPLDGVQVFAQRVLWSLPAIFILLIVAGRMAALKEAMLRLMREPILILAIFTTAALLGVQWLIFVWAPINEQMLDLTLGYFLMPLSLVLVGRIFYSEHLRKLQRIAVLFAAVGIAHELWRVGSFSWVTLLCAVGYPPYFMLRRWMAFDSFSGLFLEMLLLAPVAIYLIINYAPLGSFLTAPHLWYLLPGLGVLSALAFAAMLGASHALPLGLMGILSYIEPVLLFFMSVFWAGEIVESGEWLTYIPIWFAVLLVVFDSVRVLLKQSRHVN